MSRLRTIDMLRMGLRLAALQGAYCEGAMQAVGFAYALSPGIDRVVGDEESRREVLRGFGEPINTHPFLAGVLAGICLRLLEQGRGRAEIGAFLRTAMGAVAAVGDPFFLSALPAVTSAVAAALALWAGPVPALVFLILGFNTVHLLIRTRALSLGYRLGLDALPRVIRWLSPARSRRLTVVAAVALGTVPAGVFLRFSSLRSDSDWTVLLVIMATFALSAVFAKARNFYLHISTAVLVVALFSEVLS
jgi:mannose/fructose/N-acetylgalactosamine-specific phosphotransferase system component IID